MQQNKLESFLEASLNTFSGFFISLAVWIFIVVPLWDIPVSHADNFVITCVFTVTSILRSYIWRRWFNAGIHKKVSQFVRRYYETRRSS